MSWMPLFTFMVEMKKLRHRETEQIVKSHRVTWSEERFNPEPVLTPEPNA